jgi:integrase
MVHLNLQRRHGRKCPAGHPVDSLTTEADERKRGAKRCDCPIFASGTLNGLFRKLGTRHTVWDNARAGIEPYLLAGSWTPDAPAMIVPPAPEATHFLSETSKPLLPIADAIEKFLRQHEFERSAERTLKKYRLHLKGREGGQESKNCSLLKFANDKGLRFIQEFGGGSDLVRELIQSWCLLKLGTRTNRLGTLKTFFEFFVEIGYLEINPARIKSRRNRANRTGEEDGREDEPRRAFSDQEIERMFHGCRTYGRTKREWPKKKDGRQVVGISEYRDYNRKWSGDDVAAFVEISLFTGLRIYDVATFHVSRLQPDDTVRLRAQKNHSWVSVAVPESTSRMIQDRGRRFGPYIFGDPSGRKPDNITQTWRRRLEQLWEECGPWEHNPVHHRFRHTFVRMLLEAHTPVSVVARLVGDTEETVMKHYAHWVPELQQAATLATRKAMLNRPRFYA